MMGTYRGNNEFGVYPIINGFHENLVTTKLGIQRLGKSITQQYLDTIYPLLVLLTFVSSAGEIFTKPV